MKKQYIAKFTLVFYGFLVFGNMISTFFISYRISLLLERILQCLTVFLFNRVFIGNTKLSTTCTFIFSDLFLLKSLSTI